MLQVPWQAEPSKQGLPLFQEHLLQEAKEQSLTINAGGTGTARKRSHPKTRKNGSTSKKKCNSPTSLIDPLSATSGLRQLRNIQQRSEANLVPTDSLILPSISDPFSYIMHVYDSLISPNIPTAYIPSSNDLIRRCLFRQFFSENTKVELETIKRPSFTIEELIDLIIRITAKTGFAIC